MSLARVVARVVLPALGRRLVPAWLLMSMALGWLAQIIDWRGLIEAATALTPLQTAAAGLALAGGLPLSSRAALTPVFHAPGLRFLDRQPIEPTAWSRALLPWALAAAAPAGLVALLWETPWRGLWALLWALVCACVSVGAAAPGWRGLGLGGGVALAGALLIGAARAAPAATPMFAGLALAGCLLGIGRLHRAGRRPVGGGVGSLPGRARGPLSALIREDTLGLLRQDGRALAGALLPIPLLTGYFYFPSSNGCCSAETLETGALVLLTFGGAGGAAALAALIARRGESLDPAARPVSTRTRALSLQVTALLPTALLALALALLAGGGHRLALHGWALAAGAVLVGTWRPWRPFNTGGYVAWSLAAGFGAVASPLLSVALGGLATAAAARRLAYLRRTPWARA